MSADTVYLVTGANKGIGRAIVTLLLQRTNTTVVAAVRKPSDPTSASLPDLPVAQGNKLVLQPLLAADDFDNLASSLVEKGVRHIDIAIANAGSSSGFKPILATTVEDVLFDFEANAVGPLRLLHSIWSLLSKGGEGKKKFVLMSSSVGSIAGQETESFPSTAYGMSKAAANWLAKKASIEFRGEGLVVGVLHPGWVKTGMGQALADALGVKEPPMALGDCAERCLGLVDDWTMEKSGQFLNFDGAELPW